MELNDPLRVAAQGVKSDYNPKLQNRPPEKSQRYYPINQRNGEVDEWAALQHQLT